MGFIKRIVSKQTIWDTWNSGPGQVEKWLDKADTLIVQDSFSNTVVEHYASSPEDLDNKIREMLISD